MTNGDDNGQNVCIGLESNFAIFTKTIINYFIITAVSLIAVFAIFYVNNSLANNSIIKGEFMKKGILVLIISIFTSVVGGLNPVAYDSIVIGVGICLGFLLFGSVMGPDQFKNLINTLSGVAEGAAKGAAEVVKYKKYN